MNLELKGEIKLHENLHLLPTYFGSSFPGSWNVNLATFEELIYTDFIHGVEFSFSQTLSMAFFGALTFFCVS